VTEVIVRGLTMAQVDVAMDECSDLAALNDEIIDWSVSADLGGGQGIEPIRHATGRRGLTLNVQICTFAI
jgi:hypothetical protein